MKKDIYKILVIITTFVFSTTFLVLYCIDFFTPQKFEINNILTFGNPKSKIKVIVFEDFMCKYCREYINNIFPIIQKQYIDTNKISYVIVPVSFIYGSKPVASAAISIYELNKSKFFDFVKIISNTKTRLDSKQDILDIANELQDININALKNFLDNDSYNEYLKANFDYAKKIMKGNFYVPAFYINGKKVSKEKITSVLENEINYMEANK